MRRSCCLLAVAAIVAGCGSVDIAQLAERYAGGEVEGVRSELQCLADEGGDDAHLWLMNRAVVDLAAGDPLAGIAALRQARDRLDHLQNSYSGWIESVLLDDRALQYQGADYEDVLVCTYLALLDLVCGAGDVIPYLNQMLKRQVELREGFVTEDGQRPKLGTKSAAIGNWLLAAIEADDPTNKDEVVRQLRAVLEHEPTCALAKRELERFEREGLCQPGHGVVQVVALVGLGPYRVEREEPVSSTIFEVAQRIYNATRDRVSLPVNLIQKVKIAGLAVREDNPTAAIVEVEGARQTTEVVTDVERLARAEFESLKTQMVVRAVVRRIFKLATTEAGKELTASKAPADEAGSEQSGGKRVDRRHETAADRKRREDEERRRREANQLNSLAWDFIALFLVAIEGADTRCWALLPATFQVARLELAEGEHDVVVRAAANGQAVGAEQSVRVRVRGGRTTFVVAQVPSRQGGPAPVTSAPALPATVPIDPVGRAIGGGSGAAAVATLAPPRSPPP